VRPRPSLTGQPVMSGDSLIGATAHLRESRFLLRCGVRALGHPKVLDVSLAAKLADHHPYNFRSTGGGGFPPGITPSPLLPLWLGFTRQCRDSRLRGGASTFHQGKR